MEIFTQRELKLRYEEIMASIERGAIFIYPTDTIYGIGCNALNETSVKKIHRLKRRTDKPFSIIVPSLEWIKQHCYITKKEAAELERLPGPYTLIVTLKDNAIAPSVTLGKKTIGIRYPDHWITEMVQKLNIPIVTTSANKTGERFMTSLENLDKDVEKGVDFILYEGFREGRPSVIIDLVCDTVKKR